ncbi:hypothetical protein MRX96_025045 [Rhipicephalus microplus]
MRGYPLVHARLWRGWSLSTPGPEAAAAWVESWRASGSPGRLPLQGAPGGGGRALGPRRTSPARTAVRSSRAF